MQDLTDAVLVTQRALLDAVTPQLRAVLVDLDNDTDVFFIRFYYDGEVSEELIDLWQCAVTEASAGLDSHYNLDDGVKRLDCPKEIPVSHEKITETKNSNQKTVSRQGIVVYWRKEMISCDFDTLPFPKKEDSWPLNAQGRLLVCKALRGHVTPNLRAVLVNADEEKKTLDISFFYDQEISPDFDLIKKSFTKSWNNKILPSFHGVRLDFPQKITFMENGGWLAYARKEIPLI